MISGFLSTLWVYGRSNWYISVLPHMVMFRSLYVYIFEGSRRFDRDR